MFMNMNTDIPVPEAEQYVLQKKKLGPLAARKSDYSMVQHTWDRSLITEQLAEWESTPKQGTSDRMVMVALSEALARYWRGMKWAEMQPRDTLFLTPTEYKNSGTVLQRCLTLHTITSSIKWPHGLPHIAEMEVFYADQFTKCANEQSDSDTQQKKKRKSRNKKSS